MGRKLPHHSYLQGECYHGDGMKVGSEGKASALWPAEMGEGVGRAGTSVTLFLVILGSEYPRQARDGKTEGEGPIMACCPETEQHRPVAG